MGRFGSLSWLLQNSLQAYVSIFVGREAGESSYAHSALPRFLLGKNLLNSLTPVLPRILILLRGYDVYSVSQSPTYFN